MSELIFSISDELRRALKLPEEIDGRPVSWGYVVSTADAQPEILDTSNSAGNAGSEIK